MHDAFYLFFIKKVCAVKQIFALFFGVTGRAAYKNAYCIGHLSYVVNRCKALLYKVIKFQEIAGRVATHSQLREYNKITILLFCFFYCSNYFSSIGFKVAYMVILLSEKDFH